MKKKRILGNRYLAICMMIFCVPMGVFAESAGSGPVWDGSADDVQLVRRP